MGTVANGHLCGSRVNGVSSLSDGGWRSQQGRGGVRHLWGVQLLVCYFGAPGSRLGSLGPVSALLLGRAWAACWGCCCCRCLQAAGAKAVNSGKQAADMSGVLAF